jgi:alpha-amylase
MRTTSIVFLCAQLLACGESTPAVDTSMDVVAPDTGIDVGDTTEPDLSGDTGDTDTAIPQAAWSGWDNATVYFVITDRFYDGRSDNNDNYGREPDGELETASFQGGDLVGLTRKLEEGFFDALGVSAIWITAPYEQVRGWVSGAGIKHYGYHGYFALDFTLLDQNMGSEDELRTFVDTAHAQGIRVIFDVVMNHPGYATPADLDAFGVDVLLDGWQSATPDNLYDFIDFEDEDFGDWWGPKWIRAELGGGYPGPGQGDLTKNVDFLPDFRTDSTETDIGLPPFFANKLDTRAVERAGFTVRDYLVEWLTAWVRDYGIDGFRCDTAKHVELASWKALKEGANAALVEWRRNNPDKRFPDSDYADPSKPFWMTGEVFPHGVVRDAYFDNGFDSLINFDFAAAASAALDDVSKIETTWAEYAQKINTDPSFNVLSYLSSHDTSLFFERYANKDLAKQRRAGTLLLLTPGAVQVFYGDENARTYGALATDASHKTRSPYVFGANPDVLGHWQKLGRFRRAHRAVGAGSHTKVSDAPYTFKRELGDDLVYVVLGGNGPVTVAVAFPDGTRLRDAYSGATATVAAGAVTFTAGEVLLIERDADTP